jgi:hypothetical protein
MKNCNTRENRTTRRILPIACATALAAAFTLSLPHPAHADHVTPPSVPAEIQVPPGNEAFLVGHGVGTQNYVCRPSGTGSVIEVMLCSRSPAMDSQYREPRGGEAADDHERERCVS